MSENGYKKRGRQFILVAVALLLVTGNFLVVLVPFTTVGFFGQHRSKGNSTLVGDMRDEYFTQEEQANGINFTSQSIKKPKTNVSTTTQGTVTAFNDDNKNDSELHTLQSTRRIQYSTQKGRPIFPRAYNQRYMCRARQRPPLPEILAAKLEYKTKIDLSDLRVVIMGDSVGMQLAGAYQKAAGGRRQHPDLLNLHGYEILTHAETAGGGHVIGWRLSSMFLPENEGLPLRSRKQNGGWNRTQVKAIQNATKATFMDALIFRVPQGWIGLDQVTRQSLNQTVRLAHELLGVSTVTLLTLPIINNYQTRKDLEEVRQTNRKIRTFADHWNGELGKAKKSSKLPFVFVCSLGELVNEAARTNAQIVGLENATLDEVFLQRVSSGNNWTRPAALVCADVPSSDTQKSGTSKTCELNRLSVDGVHLCK